MIKKIIFLILIVLILICSGCMQENFDKEERECKKHAAYSDYKLCVECKKNCENMNLTFGYTSFFTIKCFCIKDAKFIKYNEVIKK